MEIIGICGKKGSGKSTLAFLLNQQRGAVAAPFAEPIKVALVAMGLPSEIFYHPNLKEISHPLLQNKTPRYAMVTLGTEWGRDMIGENFWVDLWRNKMRHMPEDSVVVVEDVRFTEEIDAIREFGGFVVCVERDTQEKPSLWQKFFAHRSERLHAEEYNIPVIKNPERNPQAMLDEFNRLYVQHRGT